MWFFVSGAMAGPAVAIETTDWPVPAQEAIRAAVAKCAAPTQDDAFFLSASGAAPDRSIELSTLVGEMEGGIAPCLRGVLTTHPLVVASEDTWSASVTLSLDPALLAAVTLPGDAAARLVDYEGAKLEDPAAAAATLRAAVAKCAVDRAFHGAIELYDPFGEKGRASTFWRLSPVTPEGEVLVTCAKAALQDAAVSFEVLGSLVVGVTAGTPPRGKITVASSNATPAALARVRNVAEQCQALHPITGPYSRSFQPEGSNVLGATSSMSVGEVMPSTEHSSCVELFPGDFPPKSAVFFTFSPG